VTIQSKYESRCRNCGGAVHVGDDVEWTKGTKGVVHTRCPDSPEPAPARTTFTKVGDEWGVRIEGFEAASGDEVTVFKRSGGTRDVVLDQLQSTEPGVQVWTTRSKRTNAVGQGSDVRVTEPGVYELGDGRIYVVKPNREKTRLYAKRLVETTSDRVNEDGGHVKIDFEYEPRAIFDIAPEDKMPLERAKELTIRYGHCIVCGKALKVAESVERGIGPICIRSFRAPAGVIDGSKTVHTPAENQYL
jgi:hypothetical protein